jgi:hypothetical protein
VPLINLFRNRVNLVIMLVLVGFISACSTTSPRKVEEVAINKSSNINQINKIYFAGFAMSGDNNSSEANFPHTFNLMKEKNDKNISLLDEKAQIAIKTVRNPNLEIITDSFGDYKKDQAISAAVVIDSEDVSQEEIGGKHKLVITLRGQIVAFNFKEMKVVGSYPLTAELIDAPDKNLNSQEIEKAVKDLYIGAGKSFVQELVNRFNKLSINSDYTRGIQVKNVSISNGFARLIEKPNQTSKDLHTFIARNFEKYLSINQNVAVLPFTKDQSVGGRLSARFSNGDVYNLEIPSPDFIVSLELKKLKKARVGGSAVEDIFGYVSIMNIKVEQPEMAKTYLDADMRFALPVAIPKTMTNNDDRAHFIESTIQLLNTFTKQISKPDTEYLEEWVESKKDNAEQFEQFLEVVNKCK